MKNGKPTTNVERTELAIKVAWWHDSDSREAQRIASMGVGNWLLDYNSRQTGHVLHLKKIEQAIIYITELTGQISDGYWENDKRLAHNYRYYCNAKVIVDGQLVFEAPSYIPKVNPLALLSNEEIKFNQAGRMILKVRNSVNPTYTYEDLRSDLQDIGDALKSRWIRGAQFPPIGV